MIAETETALGWAEFFWRVTKETPQAVFLYLVLIDLLRRRHQAKQQGRVIHLELHDPVAISDSLTATAGPQRVTVGMATETNTALPVKAVGGAPS